MDITDPQTGNIDIWTYETAGGIATRFTSDPAIDSAPIWSPDGRSIVFNSMVLGHPDMYRKSANGAGSTDTIFKSGRSKVPTDWSPDGRNILFRATDAKSNLELWVAPAAGDGPAVPFLKTSFGVSHGQFSPDGRFVAYQSNESGRWEIYVAPFPGPGGSWKVSSAGGAEPRWRRDGKELFYIAADGTLMAVTVRTEGTFDADAARPLFTIRRREITFASDLFCYDVSPDGQRFLVNSEVPEPSFVPLNLILNWTSEIGK